MTLAFLFLVTFTGGASRIDTQSLVILKPVAVVACAFALITLRPSHIVPYKWLFVGFGFVFLLSFVQLIPLPPLIWQSLPGRED
ncbi:MAG: hypothetical protein EOO77_26515, partial [Oxalobacteraceae bacterium]